MKKSLLVLSLLFAVILASAQTTRKTGLSAGIQGKQFDILVPLRLTENFALVPSLGLTYAEKASTDIVAGLAARFYTRNTKLSPYFTLRAGIGANKPADQEVGFGQVIEGEYRYDIMGGVGYGAEYFFDEHFSMGVEAQLNLAKSDKNSFRFGNPDRININTGAMATATIYF